MRRAIIFFLFLGSILSAESLYLCSRLTPEAREWNDVICSLLKRDFNIFRPQDIDLSHATPYSFDDEIFQKDFIGMWRSDFLLVLPPYGRDCAWEMGWFCGQGKKAIAYVEREGDWIKDAMVKGGLSAIITSNPQLYETLLRDEMLQKKTILISSRENLSETIKGIVQKHDS